MADDPAQHARRRTGFRIFLAFTAAALAIVAAAIWALEWDRPLAARHDPETEDAYVEGDYTTVSARVAGYVRRIAVNDNTPVSAGQVIAELEDADYQADVRQAQANLDAATAQLAQLREQARMLEQQVAQSRAQTAATRSEGRRAAEEAARQRVLLPTDVGLHRNLEQAESERARLAAQAEAGDASTTQRLRELDVIAAQSRRAEATIAEQRANLALASIRLGYTIIRAPRDGVVGTRAVRVGTLMQPGEQVIDLTPLDTVWVVAIFTERQITDIRVGQPARVRVDAFPDQMVSGHVAGISPLTGLQISGVTPDNTTGNYTKVAQRVPVKITLDPGANPLRGLIRPGMSALARIDTRGEAAVRPAR